jgi:hypothetical protein
MPDISRYYRVYISYNSEGERKGETFVEDKRITKSFIFKIPDYRERENDQLNLIWGFLNKTFGLFEEDLSKVTISLFEILTDKSDWQFKIEEAFSGNLDVEFTVIDSSGNSRKEIFYQVQPVTTMLGVFISNYQSTGDRIVGILQRPSQIVELRY